MRVFSLLLFSTIAALRGSALASPASEQLASKHQISAQTLHDVRGDYVLANGRKLQLVQVGKRLYADRIGRDRVELFEVSDHVFANYDKSLKVEFRTWSGPETSIAVSEASEALPDETVRLATK